MITIGVIADTHIPDRAHALNPEITAVFKDASVSTILHAGDVSTPNVLKELETIAPVYAVQGNRDWLLLRQLPFKQTFEFKGIKIGMTHGHGKLARYLLDKVHYTIHGYNHEHIIPWLLNTFPETNVIVFGHGHISLNRRMDGQLLFNPGSPHVPKIGVTPSVGLLFIRDEGEVCGEIIELT